ncbi:LysR family transcriptional regulator [Serratia rhizosphaerae]|uniref:LysR family transcriptional regulator n=1 Tax=Serratia sp. Tan611 TaxID=2773264 RepID=UPI0019349533|nr:LysR family transcriptional regulator [Serratia sp. Tan611]MBU3892434.1 LysR family transcriptional regulator [Serratia rubidaea]CAE1146107.1 DNA-binding transcriptional LysR family regulator [Serratia sp. Tan611]
MQLSQLRAFCAVVSTGSITAAAKVLNRVPSGVTIRIQQLEDDLQCQLFVREKKRLTLSPAGRQLLEYAPQLIEQADKLRSLMRNEQAQGCLTIGAIDLGLIAFMPTLIGRFRERYRGVNMDIRCEPSERLVEQVLDGTLDIALTDGPVQSPSLESDYAFSDQLVLITEKNHPIVTNASELCCQEVYGFRQNCSYRLRLDSWLLKTPQAHLKVVEMESYHTMFSCVSAGVGAAWIPQTVLDGLPGRDSVKVHTLGPSAQSDLYFIWRKGHLTDNAKRILQLHHVG